MSTRHSREWERAVAEFLASSVDDSAREHGRAVVADVLAAAVAGSAALGVAGVARDAVFSGDEASILGTDRRAAPPQAAMTNAAAAIAQEVEEGHNTGGHVGAGIVAGGLAAAEANDVDGETFVDACTRAYEICVRLERAIFAMKDQMNDAIPWLVRNPHSTWTTVGPAVTSAICLDATAEELTETFRIAANLAVISMHDPYAEGAPARNFTAGFSAQAGVTAALTAIAGLEGSRAAIEAVYDPFEELLPDGFASQFETLGTEWAIAEHYVKPYPSCRYTHPPLDALREAIDVESVDPSSVESVTVRTFANATDMSHPEPETMTAGKFSAPYVLATYLCRGSVDLEGFTPEALADETVRSVAARVELREDEGYEAEFPESWGARVAVELRNGTTLTGSRDYPRGDYRDPMPDAEYRERNRVLLAHGLSGDQKDTARVDEALDALDTVAERPIRETVAALRP
ncbi:2-methylcitrate dehydratase PrpD [Halorubrum trapanicum]|uniref:2-methylcitrate dehydratase PrpD n=1 Tax=Halorubrum trapanicum TaxID=29284 RepID=A0A8J7RFA5_9EURY|nr:MmgE/PrpD family protein [Halorubrum trapanicum]MBP1902876.1 2-methylcitrate dehydratase PrpD [Halorubrum trapanicum]